MKSILLLICSVFSLPLIADNDTIPAYPLTEIDSILASPSDPVDSIARALEDSLAENLFFDTQLAWLDTIPCSADSIIFECPDSVYKARLQALPFVIEMPYHPIIRDFINRYIKNSQRLAGLSRKAERYFPMFEDILGKYDLPYELCYLAVIESALNPQVHSPAGAAGLWQFMPSTGKLYGLEINSLVDERMDPIKSTEAACRFLSSLYNTFCDWNLAIAAYNCGPGNINKAIHRSGKRDFWSIYPYLPRETRSYLPLFIAAAYVMNYADAHGICPGEANHTMLCDTIITHQRIHLQQVSDIMGINLNELRHLNPQYTRDIIPGGEKAYTLCLPIDQTGVFLDMQDTILAHRANELIHNRRAEIELLHTQSLSGGYSVNGVTYYKVKKGDTLGAIAKRFHVKVADIKRWNHLKNDNINIGKTLRIGG